MATIIPENEVELDRIPGAELVKLVALEPKSLEDEVPEPIAREEKCGIACWKPEWLQKFRNMRSFAAVFVITGITQGMFYPCWSMSLSSIEKRFQISSQTMGILSAVNDAAHVAVVIFVAHFCGKGHRPRWMAACSLLLGIAVLLMATPELFMPHWETQIVGDLHGNQTDAVEGELCAATKNGSLQDPLKNDKAQAKTGSESTWAIVIIGTGQALLGIATIGPIVLGLPFIDDNVKVKNSPIYFSLGIAGRMLGPILGALLSAWCLATYIDLTKQPNISQTDPRWMGAWHLNYIIVGAIVCVTSVLYWFFPKRLSPTYASAQEKTIEAGKSVPTRDSAKTLIRDLKRLFANKIFVIKLVNDCIDGFVISGHFAFWAKYMQYHFQVSASKAGLVSYVPALLAVAIGGGVGGILIRQLKLTPKQVAMSIAGSSFLAAVCFLVQMSIKCEPQVLHSFIQPDEMLLVDTSCTHSCSCPKKFSPVCDEDLQLNYFSSCYAGCNAKLSLNETERYGRCNCLAQDAPLRWFDFDGKEHQRKDDSDRDSSYKATEADTKKTLKRGFCQDGCSGLWIYVAIGVVFDFFNTLPFSGNQMLSFRIVDTDLKPISKAVQTFVMSTFAFIPGPIVMGSLIDSTCRLWNRDETSGERGACLMYDLDDLRFNLHFYVGLIKGLACLLDIYVVFKVKDMSFERDAAKEPIESS